MNIGRKSPVSLNAPENGNRSVQPRAAEFMADRDGDLPVWVRSPKRGCEFYSGCSRAKLDEWAGEGFIRSISIREPGRIKGVRLFHLASISTFIKRCEMEVKSDLNDTGKYKPNQELTPVDVQGILDETAWREERWRRVSALLTASDETPPSEEDAVDLRWFGCESHLSRLFHRDLHGFNGFKPCAWGIPTAIEVDVTSEPKSEP